MSSRSFELILISPPEEYSGEAGFVNRLFSEGLGTFHLRKPGWTVEQLVRYIREIEPQYHKRIMVHYREEVRRHVEVKGIHFRCRELPLQKPAFEVSSGLHSWNELSEVAERIDYAFVSPFFDSISKEGYLSDKQLWQVPEGVEREKAVALGGINAENINTIRSLGLRGAAVLGTVWKAAGPVEAFLELKYSGAH